MLVSFLTNTNLYSFLVSPGQSRGVAYKTFWVWDGFLTRGFLWSLFEQSQQHLAYMWLKSMLKLQIGEILTKSKSHLSGAWALTLSQTQNRFYMHCPFPYALIPYPKGCNIMSETQWVFLLTGLITIKFLMSSDWAHIKDPLIVLLASQLTLTIWLEQINYLQ